VHEPEFYNYTPYVAELVPQTDRDGAECRVAVVKATFALPAGRAPMLHDTPRPIRAGDEMWEKPEVADVRYPGDLCVLKPGTDFVVVGHAVAPHGREVPFVDVTVHCGTRTKVLRVFGDRLWVDGALGVRLGEPEPLVRVPLAWSRAYGGFDASVPDKPVEEPRNPVGRGVARRSGALVGRPGPQIDDPDHPVRSPSRRHTPVGCAALGRHFEPRRTHAGTCDAGWLQTRFPGRPADYRDEHQNAAPPDQVFTSALRGGEDVYVGGVHVDGPISFKIPRRWIVIEAEIDGATQTARPHLDTVLVDGDARLVEMVWRGSFRCPAKMRNRFKLVRVIEKEVVS
jgi:hypothetical protein